MIEQLFIPNTDDFFSFFLNRMPQLDPSVHLCRTDRSPKQNIYSTDTVQIVAGLLLQYFVVLAFPDLNELGCTSNESYLFLHAGGQWQLIESSTDIWWFMRPVQLHANGRKRCSCNVIMFSFRLDMACVVVFLFFRWIKQLRASSAKNKRVVPGRGCEKPNFFFWNAKNRTLVERR